jgi:superfamily II DNA helicase RecQ
LIQEGTAIVVSPLIALMKTVDAIRVYLQREVLLKFKFTHKTEIAQVKKRHLFRPTKLLYVALNR